jgi:hypothetical protein
MVERAVACNMVDGFSQHAYPSRVMYLLKDVSDLTPAQAPSIKCACRPRLLALTPLAWTMRMTLMI